MHILTFLLCSVLRVCCLSAAPPGWSHFGLSWHGPVGHGRREHLRVNCSHNPSYVIRSTVPNTLKLAWRKLAGRSSSVAIFWSLRWRARCLPLDNRYNNYEMDLWNWEVTWRAANERILSSNISCWRVCEPLTVDLMVRDRVSRALCSISKSCSGALKRQWVTVGATTEIYLKVTTPQPSLVESGSTKIIWNVCTTKKRLSVTSFAIIVHPNRSALFRSSFVPFAVNLVGMIISARLGFWSFTRIWSRRTRRKEVISYLSCSSTPQGNRLYSSNPDIGVCDTSESTLISPSNWW